MLEKIFKSKKPIIGMIHLAGQNPIKQAIDELDIYEECGIDGVIIENYHNGTDYALKVIKELENRDYSLAFGINILGNNAKSYEIAKEHDFIKFIQVDAIRGKYLGVKNDYGIIEKLRQDSDAALLGGVWPKYYSPVNGSDLGSDLIEAKSRCDAIVVTGEGTGMQTPYDKIKKFREIIGDFPLVIGAGIDNNNFAEQLSIADACIVGSYFKNGHTEDLVIKEKARDKLIAQLF